LAGQDQQGQDGGGRGSQEIEAISQPLPRTPRLLAVASPKTGTAMPMAA